jgi:hypothetical protein
MSDNLFGGGNDSDNERDPPISLNDKKKMQRKNESKQMSKRYDDMLCVYILKFRSKEEIEEYKKLHHEKLEAKKAKRG